MFANYFVENYAKKGSGLRVDSSEEDSSENEDDSRKNEANNESTRIVLVSSIGGRVNDVESEKEYLRRMAEVHLRQYEEYQRAYLELAQ